MADAYGVFILVAQINIVSIHFYEVLYDIQRRHSNSSVLH